MALCPLTSFLAPGSIHSATPRNPAFTASTGLYSLMLPPFSCSFFFLSSARSCFRLPSCTRIITLPPGAVHSFPHLFSVRFFSSHSSFFLFLFLSSVDPLFFRFLSHQPPSRLPRQLSRLVADSGRALFAKGSFAGSREHGRNSPASCPFYKTQHRPASQRLRNPSPRVFEGDCARWCGRVYIQPGYSAAVGFRALSAT